ncbi:hypothetical protein D7X12_16720 [Corallococcus sicarius]|uniref:Uncharacterized protein n=2 Tax=Corallococcus sicarius TaxID=2316726 RepID=A0A3A8NFE5_9BACT|nr:hypothetical protein D7X12_16720 [Corallococcus sicarius]
MAGSLPLFDEFAGIAQMLLSLAAWRCEGTAATTSGTWLNRAPRLLMDRDGLKTFLVQSILNNPLKTIAEVEQYVDDTLKRVTTKLSGDVGRLKHLADQLEGSKGKESLALVDAQLRRLAAYAAARRIALPAI